MMARGLWGRGVVLLDSSGTNSGRSLNWRTKSTSCKTLRNIQQDEDNNKRGLPTTNPFKKLSFIPHVGHIKVTSFTVFSSTHPLTGLFIVSSDLTWLSLPVKPYSHHYKLLHECRTPLYHLYFSIPFSKFIIISVQRAESNISTEPDWRCLPLHSVVHIFLKEAFTRWWGPNLDTTRGHR